MKKALIASLVVAASAPAFADLYGHVDVRVQNGNESSVFVDSARIGLKGGTEGDVSSVYKIEFQVPGNGGFGSTAKDDVTVRKAFVGMDGAFGAVRLGRIDNPYAAAYVADSAYTGSGSYENQPFRLGNSISYALPTMSGFSAFVAATAYEGDAGEDAADKTTYGVTFDMAGFNVVLAASDSNYDVTETNEDGEDVTTGSVDGNSQIIGLKYSIAGFDIAGHYETAEKDGADDAGDGSVSVAYSWEGYNVAAGMSQDTGTDQEDTMWAQVGLDLAEGASSTLYYKDDGTDDVVGLGVKVTF